MQPKNTDFLAATRAIFKNAPFMADLGVALLDLGAGWCETELLLAPRHMQQNNFVHAGVQTTIADHTAGAAAHTLVAADEYVLTVEFKMNFLRAAQGEKLYCRATVLKPGSTITVVESEVYTLSGERKTLTVKGTMTLAVLKTTAR